MSTSPGFFPSPWWGTTSPGWSPSPDVACLSVSLGPIQFATSHDAVPQGPVVWSLHEIDGWDDVPQPATSTTPHPSGHGQIAGMHRMEARFVTLSGLLIGTGKFGVGSPSEAMDTLRALKTSTLVMAEKHGLSREVGVRVTQTQVTRVPGAAHVARFTITLAADDPLRYGSGVVTLGNGASTLVNRGDETAWPLIEVTGPVTVTVAGAWGTMTAAVPSGAHTIDCRHGVVWSPSGARAQGVTSGPWPYVRPGGQAWTVGGLSSSGRVRVRRSEAWS